MQEIRSSNPPVVTEICDPNKSRARQHLSFAIAFFIVLILAVTVLGRTG